jgi:glycosidase
VPDAARDGDGGPGDGDAGPTVRDCVSHFRLTAPDAAGVELTGAWDWTTREPMTDADGDGTFELDRELPAGLWPYKFVVVAADGGETWQLDPGNPYRAYDGGVENSAARIVDCAEPELVVVSRAIDAAGARVAVRFVKGRDEAPLDRASLKVELEHDFARAAVVAGAIALDDQTITVDLAGLAPGKHTLRVAAADADGRAAAPIVVPFWIEAERFDWRGAPIYMVMIDRFVDGDPAGDPPPALGADPAADYHGGDLVGLAGAIEDGVFDDLGVRALWLSPPARNADGVHYDDGHGVTGYHGYWPVRAREVEPRIGGEAGLEAVVRAAHARGIRVLLDYVVNHVHEDHEYVAAHRDWFRTGCTCGSPGCDWTEHRLDCSFRDYLPDVNWQVPAAGEQMIDDALWWLERFDLDGLRVDAVKHVEDAAIGNLATRVGERFEAGGTDYFLLGETAMGWGGDDVANSLAEYATIARYVGAHALSGQFDFVLYHATAYRVFADLARGLAHLDYWTRMSLEHYPKDAIMTPFVGSHDSERLISLATYGSGDPRVHHKWSDQERPAPPTGELPYQRAGLALTWLLSIPGAPLLYYGDEYGEHGGADPDNRHMWRPPGERDDRQAALAERVGRAGRARARLRALRLGDYRPLFVSEDVLVFARVDGDAAALVALNLGGQTARPTVELPADLPLAGPLHDHLALGTAAIEIADGRVTLELPPRGAAILAPEAP